MKNKILSDTPKRSSFTSIISILFQPLIKKQKMKLTLTILLCLVSNIFLGQSTKYFRQLAYNHVSPHVSIKGTHEVDAKTAEGISHYVFKYDKQDRLIEITNYHFQNERKHPLTHIGVHKMKIEYKENKEVRIFYDKLGRRMANLRKVYKEEYTYDKEGFKTALAFFDLENKPMESSWKIATYKWKKKKNWVIENRFNLAKEATPVAPYFEFNTTAIEYDSKGFPKAHYNLNEDMEVANSSFGVASYKDIYDDKGNHIKWSYYDVDNRLALSTNKYAISENEFDSEGTIIMMRRFDDSNKLLWERSVRSEPNKFVKITSKDSLAIKEKSLGYLKALREIDPELMENVMNEKLAKRTQGYDRKTKKEIPRETTYEQMIKFAEGWNNAGDKFPEVPTEEAIILDAYHTMASVKLVSDNWVEYLHLIKLDGEWEIINLLWQHKDTSRYPH